MTRNLPIDILWDILEYVDKAGLATICRVSKICCFYSQDVLYRDIGVKTPSAHRVLAQSTHLASKVRSFDTNFESDLAVILRNMTSLRILKLPSGICADILDGCTFKLDSFECVYVYDPSGSFQRFLNSQPSLKSVTFPMNFGSTVSVDATCLPNLTRFKATYPWLPYLIPGRPLNEVILDGFCSYENPTDLSFFALSTTPIQKLTIDYSFLYSTPAHLLASFLPSLTHFTLTVKNRFISSDSDYEGVCGLPLY